MITAKTAAATLIALFLLMLLSTALRADTLGGLDTFSLASQYGGGSFDVASTCMASCTMANGTLSNFKFWDSAPAVSEYIPSAGAFTPFFIPDARSLDGVLSFDRATDELTGWIDQYTDESIVFKDGTLDYVFAYDVNAPYSLLHDVESFGVKVTSLGGPQPDPAPVPEPASIVLFGVVLIGCAARARNK